ncbi:hypothetical protein Kpol_1002p75 [Vanderwaltozyma polyspora DSM 70294]|uniref:Uncharacterized protein n=1 Tax=Vanderwaltozyma polyspora (strain ATCC 22028 / DSM 70294 / BCRC 21397 / CBS 2163 / NBRC 10782 / NRRL Y-8283 / UCD 57-17) TaxID=436907 RepID=A7TEA6_VANPO|nr:uncharacterized protein Kpol_1002p75 [Vanderwaltozyma polyspora DSM 70294]EDO19428.1 hypothetical protein Kpol_1002p75 [Vanderwaltozyma polyspora DSM 70294]
MGNRGRTMKPDSELQESGNGGVRDGNNSPLGTLSNPNLKYIRQFSTRSRTKSSASFKGLNRYYSSDGTFDPEISGSTKHGSLKKCKSSDILYKRRTCSGLNMTSISGKKGHENTGESRWNTVIDGPLSFGGGGLKPRRGKSTHSVLELHDADEARDDDSTTDEEVEYFTEEDEEQAQKQKMESQMDKSNQSQLGNPRNERFPEGEMVKNNIPAESKLLRKDSDVLAETNNDAPLLRDRNRDNSNTKLTNQLSYKPPSHMIKPSNSRSSDFNKSASSQDIKANDNDENFINNDEINDDDIIDDDIIDDVGEDHIDAVTSPSDLIETEAHSLKRQGKHSSQLNALQKENNKVEVVDENIISNEHYVKPEDGHTDQYVPDMILSQSTGVERHFENQLSMSNTLGANDYNQINEQGEIPKEVLMKMENRESMKKNNGANELQFNTIREQQNQNLQSSRPKSNSNFSNSISSLTNNLQRGTPEGYYGGSKFNKSSMKSASQNSLEAHNERVPSKHNESLLSQAPQTRQNNTSLNNFAQFLKSDGMDGDSRTQRKLWLQRENSIMDLNLQNDHSHAVFMASNIEVKREFERISHEYTSVRRFYNPIREALTRVSSTQRHHYNNGSHSQSLNADLGEILFSNYGEQTKSVNELTNSSTQAKLNRVLANIWKEETANFNKDTNPLAKNKLASSGHHMKNAQPARHSLRGVIGSGTGLHHQRTINSFQPTTRAVHRRMENNMNAQQQQQQQHQQVQSHQR